MSHDSSFTACVLLLEYWYRTIGYDVRFFMLGLSI